MHTKMKKLNLLAGLIAQMAFQFQLHEQGTCHLFLRFFEAFKKNINNNNNNKLNTFTLYVVF